MKLVPDSGAYQSVSVIANAQRCVNLYPETNPQNTKPPTPVTHYQRPGKTLLGSPGAAGNGRGLYRATNGHLYSAVGDSLYYVDAAWTHTFLGTIGSGSNPVSMADNGQNAGDDLVLVTGDPNAGYVVTLSTNAFAPIVDPSFVGSTAVQYVQTFFLFNYPNTQNWYISLPDSVTFDALDIAAKATYADNIETIGVRQGEAWLIGSLSTEPWSLSGDPAFAFQAIPSTFTPYGIVAKYSLTFADVSLFWLSRNLQGQAIVVKTEGYQVKRVSTYALEAEFQTYATVEDCIGGTYQVNGHTFVVFHFPTADVSYAYDLSTEQWHQEAWTDGDGALRRDRASFYANAYGEIVGQDWETGDIYRLDPNVYTDDGDLISYVRGFPHVLNDLKRLTHWVFWADMQCGTIVDETADPQLNLRWSDNRGQSFGDWVQTPLGRTGEYLTSPQFQRLGMARDRVYELMWSVDMKTALNGAYIGLEESDS